MTTTGTFSALKVELLDRSHWRLLERFDYAHAHRGCTVPAGFLTDFDSIPRLPLVYVLLFGRAIRASVLHDFLYADQAGRHYADAVFLEAMRDDGLWWFHRWPIYWGVRVFGGFAYRKHGRAA